MIEFEQVGFSYGARTVLSDVTLALEPGSLSFLAGRSGAGKTTFLRLCHLDLAPDRGVVRFWGRSISPRDRDGVADLRKAIGVVPQDPGFLEHLTLLENVALPLRVAGLGVAGRSEDLRALLDWVDLADRADAFPAELSGGERQRAALARAVILSPEAILADEPTGAADRDMAARLIGLLVELNRMGKTVLVATHDPDLMRAVAGRVEARVLRLEGGRVAAIEPAEAGAA
ncbi:ATP-binding cassette domain-containing protein [Amaricoccus sp.]|uniref:cell division ATP-binding protein FtsE n=1 Tax=Amaricoccus sp. TaxID=1872485 RepID=UPI001B50E2AD|nr:ATP-binding cassette domain-containing protein [Amaricoccus sp.]MBP7240487.1 ATP-binding cassette domain-containing protein [Amaricoccus sp.]